MAGVTLARATRSIEMREDHPYVARCDTLARVSHRVDTAKYNHLVRTNAQSLH